MAQGILLVMSKGFEEVQVLNMAIDKFELYVEAVAKNEMVQRRQFVVDTASAVGGALGGKGFDAYIESLTV
jgi:hypothetical protein